MTEKPNKETKKILKELISHSDHLEKQIAITQNKVTDLAFKLEKQTLLKYRVDREINQIKGGVR